MELQDSLSAPKGKLSLVTKAAHMLEGYYSNSYTFVVWWFTVSGPCLQAFYFKICIVSGL